MKFVLFLIFLTSNTHAFYNFNNYTGKLIDAFESINDDQKTTDINCDQYSNDSYISIDSFRVNMVNGWKLVQWPYASNKKKYQILLLPGFMLNDYVFHDLIKVFYEKYKDVRVVAGVPPGFGAQEREGFSPTFTNYITEVETFISKYDFDLVLGHSFMGTVLGAISEKNIYQGKMILLSPALEMSDESFSIRQLAKLRRTFFQSVSWEAVYFDIEAGFEDYYTKTTDQDIISKTASQAYKLPKESAIIEFNSYADYFAENPNIMNKMVKSKNQIMVLRGEDDIVDISKSNQDKAKLNKNLSYKVLEKGNHMIMQEEPELLAKTIWNYLKN